MKDAWDYGPLAVVLLLVALLGIAAFESVQATRLERLCLAHGYARSDWRWIGPNYCITRTDQTDVVVPVDAVR